MYPPAPWNLQGQVYALAYLIESEAAEACVPDGFEVVSVVPGKTLGGLYVAHYGAGSTLTYDELIVVPALVRFGGRVGAWISHIYVNHPTSVAGGRAIWGLPKALAEFEWDDDGDDVVLRVRAQGQDACRLRLRRRFGVWTPPACFRFFSLREGEVMQSTVRARADAEWAYGHVEWNAHEPFAELGLRDTRLAVALRPVTATIYAPQRVGPLEGKGDDA